MFRFKSLYLLLALFILGCTEQSKVESTQEKEVESLQKGTFALFDKLTDESGFQFVNQLLEDEVSNILTYEYLYNGSGVAIGDINNDGLPDIFMGGNFFGGRLFLNKGNLQFEQISETAGVFFEGFTTGVSFVDVNNDGYDDIYMCRSKSKDVDQRRNMLLINNQDLTFTDKAKEYGVDDPGYATNAIFFDYDNDDDLDLYVLNHRYDFKNAYLILKNGQNYLYEESNTTYSTDRLYQNEGGIFKDVSQEAGVINNRFGLGVSATDINDDGWLDLYIANDFNDKDQILINNKKGQLVDQIDQYMDHMSKNSMGCEVGDFNNDGLEDIVTLDMTAEDNYRQKQLKGAVTYDVYQLALEKKLGHQLLRNCLHINEGNGSYSEVGQLTGISHTDWSWTPILADFDNDGNKDLFVANGYYRDITNMDYIKYRTGNVMTKSGGVLGNWQTEIIKSANSTPLVNYLFQNTGENDFIDISQKTWGADSSFSNGCVYADLDLDGDLDLIVNNFNQPSSIYKNNSEKAENNYICFIPESSYCKVYLYSNNSVQMVCSNPYRGYMSSHHNVVHFGLGKQTKIDSVVYIEKNQAPRKISNPEINKYHNLNTQNSEICAMPQFNKSSSELSVVEAQSLLQSSDLEEVRNDFKDEPLLSRRISGRGPFIAKGDINKDGLDDLFISGKSGVSGKILLQKENKSFEILRNKVLESDRLYNDSKSCLFDADSDGDLDLYITSSGYSVQEDLSMYQDRLYINDGKGTFTKQNLPLINENTSCVIAKDINNDNQLDLLVFAGAKPGNFPECDPSFVLINDKGTFTRSENFIGQDSKLGIVTDAIEMTIEGKSVIVLAKEWDAIQAFSISNNQVIDYSSKLALEGSSGIWNSLSLTDVNMDGTPELILGNNGLNDFFLVSENREGTLIAGDFYNTGSTDALEFYHFKDSNSYIKYSLEELGQQNPLFRREFPRYTNYSNTTMTQFMSHYSGTDFIKKTINRMESSLIKNTGTKFKLESLPTEAQYTEIHGSITKDINQDGILDLVLIGNNYHSNVQLGIKDAGGIQVFLSDENSNTENFNKHKYQRIKKGEFIDVVEVNESIYIIDNEYKIWEIKYQKDVL